MRADCRYLAVIPARGGSKRLPRKNIMLLEGKPLIAWSIDAATNAASVDDVVVSTDDDEIAQIAQEHGAMVPFMRPAILAQDDSSSVDVLLHALDYYAEQLDKKYDYVVLLQPTSPLRTAKHIDEAIALLEAKQADGVISVCEVDHPVQWCNTLPEDGCMNGFLADVLKHSRSQELPTCYRLNGAIYIASVERLHKEKSLFFNDNIFAYVMEKEASVDIDTAFDFDFAECLLQKRVR